MVSPPPLASPPDTILTRSRWNALLDPRQYFIQDQMFRSEPWRSTFYSKSGPVSREDSRRIRRILDDFASYMKLQINNAPTEGPSGDRLMPDVEEGKQPKSFVQGCCAEWVRPGGRDPNKKEYEALVTLDSKFLYDLIRGNLNVSPRHSRR